MKINKINSTPNFYANSTNAVPIAKQFQCELKDGSIAKVRFNHLGLDVKSIECYTFDKNNNPIGGMAYGKNPQLQIREVSDFLLKVQSSTLENVFRKFVINLLSKK